MTIQSLQDLQIVTSSNRYYCFGGTSVPVSKTMKKILSFEHLQEGWHYDTGKAPSRTAVESALYWNKEIILHGFEHTDAFPGIDGEILVTGYKDNHYIEVLVDIDYKFTVRYEKDDKLEISVPNLSAENAAEVLKFVSDQIWNTSDFSTSNILIEPSSASYHSHSEIRPATAVYQLSIPNVLRASGALHVYTHESITGALQESPLFTGGLIPPYYLPTK